METKKLCCGIDVSHTTLDVCYQNNLGDFFHLKVGNNITGFKKIIEHTGTQYQFVMEEPGHSFKRSVCKECSSKTQSTHHGRL